MPPTQATTYSPVHQILSDILLSKNLNHRKHVSTNSIKMISAAFNATENSHKIDMSGNGEQTRLQFFTDLKNNKFNLDFINN